MQTPGESQWKRRFQRHGMHVARHQARKPWFSGQKEGGEMKRYNSKAGRFVGLRVGMLHGAPAWGQPAVVAEVDGTVPWMDNATHATLLARGRC